MPSRWAIKVASEHNHGVCQFASWRLSQAASWVGEVNPSLLKMCSM
jgi:hypothetical protein